MFYHFARNLLKFIYQLLFRLEAKNLHYVPVTGGVVLCSNHISLLDPPAIGVFIKRRISFMAKKELFDVPLLGSIIKKLGAFPVNRSGVGKETIKTAMKLLREGEMMGIFPEGTRNQGGAAAKKGAAMIALKSGAAIIPVAVIGSYKLFGKTRIVYGPAIDMTDILEEKSSDMLEKATERIMDHIHRILREEQGLRA